MVHGALPRAPASDGGSGETQPASLLGTFGTKERGCHCRVMTARMLARCVVGCIVIRRHNALSGPFASTGFRGPHTIKKRWRLGRGRTRAGDRRAAALPFGLGGTLSLQGCTACARGWWRRDDRLRGLHEGTGSCPQSRSPHRSRWLQQKTGVGRPG